jgi:anti-anti-sigma regulatory factor
MTLRIQRSAEGEQVVFTLCGRIQAEQVEELHAHFKSGSPRHDIVLDLKEVKLVDRNAVRFLAHREAEGTKLRNCPAYIREWILREGNRNGK